MTTSPPPPTIPFVAAKKKRYETETIPRAQRKRKTLEVTLSPTERRMADELSDRHADTLSRIVGAAIRHLHASGHATIEKRIDEANAADDEHRE